MNFNELSDRPSRQNAFNACFFAALGQFCNNSVPNSVTNNMVLEFNYMSDSNIIDLQNPVNFVSDTMKIESNDKEYFSSKVITSNAVIDNNSLLSELSILQHPKTVKALYSCNDLDSIHAAIHLDLIRIELQNLLFQCLRQSSAISSSSSKTAKKHKSDSSTSTSPWWLSSSPEVMTKVTALVQAFSAAMKSIRPRRKFMKVWDALYDYPKVYYAAPDSNSKDPRLCLLTLICDIAARRVSLELFRLNDWSSDLSFKKWSVDDDFDWEAFGTDSDGLLSLFIKGQIVAKSVDTDAKKQLLKMKHNFAASHFIEDYFSKRSVINQPFEDEENADHEEGIINDDSLVATKTDGLATKASDVGVVAGAVVVKATTPQPETDAAEEDVGNDSLLASNVEGDMGVVLAGAVVNKATTPPSVAAKIHV